jgi:hypothetical protein
MNAHAAMTLRGPVDDRRQLRPLDYCQPPAAFGHAMHAVFLVPDGGDPVSMEIARFIHVVICAWRRTPGAPSGAALGRAFGFSRQTWSATVLGRRWPGHTVLSAAVLATHPGGVRL